MKNDKTTIFDEAELDQDIEQGKIKPVDLPEFSNFSEIEKYQFCTEIIRFAKSKNLKQKDISEMLGINKSEVSKLFSYNLKEFSQERLLGFIHRLLELGAEINLVKAYMDISKHCSNLQKKISKQLPRMAQA